MTRGGVATHAARRVVARRVATLALGLAGCTPVRHANDARVEAAAVHELFVTREHARRIVLWTDRAERGPTFDVLQARDADVDTAALGAAIPAPVVGVDAPDLDRLFRAHPDGWAAFFARYPAAPGLVELARPAWSGDTLASVVVGRACGEHCFNAWRVTVAWPSGRVLATAGLHLPKS